MTYPPPPPAYGPPFTAGPPPARPAAVEWAFRLMLVRASLSLVGLVVLALSQQAVRDRIDRQQQRLGDAGRIDVDTLVRFAVVTGVVVAVVFLVLYVVLAFQVRRGRQWARVTTWVFAGLGVLGLLTQFAVTSVPATHVVTTVSGLVDLVVIVLLARPATSAYVAAMRFRRH